MRPLTRLRRVFTPTGVAVAALAALCAVQWLTADRTGGFWWFDSASHAMNGVLIWDAVRQAGFLHPLSYAVGYFSRYPAITLGFYPPGFAIFLAPFYAIFGVSQGSAQIAVSCASFLLGLGVFVLARQAGLVVLAALAAAILALVFPEMLIWGRQIQPETLCYAGAVWSVVALRRWLAAGRARDLLWACLLFLAALYTKQTVAFLALPMGLAALARHRGAILRQPGVGRAALLSGVLALPLVGMTVAFGGMNARQAASAPGAGDALFYLRTLPAQLGWAGLLLALVGTAIAWRQRMFLTLGWVGVGLVFFSAIALKSTRFATAILPALATLAVLPFTCLPRRWAGPGALGFAVLAAVWGFVAVPERVAPGFVQAAGLAAGAAARGSTILLLAQRSANFVFALRARGDRPDLRVVRAEKLYARYRVAQAFGVADSGADEARIMAEMRADDVSVVVVERGFWRNLPSLARLEDRLGAAPFRLLVSVPSTPGVVLDIYRRLDYVFVPRVPVELRFPLIGLRVIAP